MLNENNDNRDILFIDIDVLVYYDAPDDIFYSDDVEYKPLPGAIEFLNENKNSYLVFTSKRNEKRAMKMVRSLLAHGFMPKEPPVLMCGLPTGTRHLISSERMEL